MKKLIFIILTILFVANAYTQININNILASVNKDTLRKNIVDLCSFGVRDTSNKTNLTNARNWIFARLLLFGLDTTSIKITWNGTTYINPIGVLKPTTTSTGKTVYLTAHYDSKVGVGADDNGTGVSTLLEIARVLKAQSVPLRDTVKFVFHPLEEYGIYGSGVPDTIISRGLFNSTRIEINVDMIGYNPNQTTCISQDTMNVSPTYNNAASKKAADSAAVYVLRYSGITNVPTRTDQMYFDQQTWEARGFVTVGFFEGESTPYNPYWHTSNDIINYVDTSLVRKVARGVLATTIKLGGTPDVGIISPSQIVTNKDTTIYINGYGFVSSDTIYIDNAPFNTTYISPTQLSVNIPGSYIPTPRTLILKVKNADIYTDLYSVQVVESGGGGNNTNIIDNFNSYSIGDTLAGKNKWKTITTTVYKFTIGGDINNKYVVTNDDWRTFQIYYDTTVTSFFNYGIRMINAEGLNYIKFVFTTQLNELWSNGYEFGYTKYSGMDSMRIRYYSSGQILLGSIGREMMNGDTLAVKYSGDTLYFGAFNGENSSILTIVNNTHKTVNKYVQIYIATGSNYYNSFDDFMYFDWSRKQKDDTPPTIVSYDIYPQYWETTTTGYIETRVTDNTHIDSVYIRFNNADSLKVKCYNTNDTTVRWNITAPKSAGTYYYNVRAVDTAGNVTTTTNKSIIVYPAGYDELPPVVQNYYITPDRWDTSTTGQIVVRVTDNKRVDSVYIRFNNADVYKAKFANRTQDTTIYYNLGKQTAGSYTYNVRAVDSVGNVTTTSNKVLIVSNVIGNFKGMIAWIPNYHIERLNASSPSIGNSYNKLRPQDIPYKKITHLVYMIDWTTWTTSAPYSYVYAGSSFDIETETAVSNTGQSTQVRQAMRDSCSKNNVKFILGLTGLGNYGSGNPSSQGGIFDQNIQDSAKTQQMVDSIYRYLVIRGYDGVALNIEFPQIGGYGATAYLRFLRLLHQKLKAHNPPLWIGNCANRSPFAYAYPNPPSLMDAYVDVTMPMFYGYATVGNGGYHSNIYPTTCYTSGELGWAPVSKGVDLWIVDGNCDKTKLAGAFVGEAVQISGMTQPCAGSKPNNAPYYSMTYMYSNGISNIYYNADAIGAHAPFTNSYISGDAAPVIVPKLNYYEQRQLGYLWVWDIARGYVGNAPSGIYPHLVIDSAYSYLKGYSKVPFPSKLLYPPKDTILQQLSVQLKWNKAKLASSYGVVVADNINFTNPIISSITSDTVYNIQSGLLYNNRTYYWKVASTSADGESEYSAIFSFVISTSELLNAPNLISPVNNTSNLHPDSITLKWNKVINNAYYRVVVALDSLFNNVIINTTTYDTTVNIAIGVLGQGLKYYWRVRSENPESYWSSVWSYSTRIINPETKIIEAYSPSNNAVINENVVNYVWQKVLNRNYNLEVKTDTNSSNYYLYVGNLVDTFYTAIYQHINGVYYWRITTVGDTVKSSWSKYTMNISSNQYSDTTVTIMTIVYDKNLKKMKYEVPQIMIREALPAEIPTPPIGYQYLFIHKTTKQLMLIDSNRNTKIYNNQ